MTKIIKKILKQFIRLLPDKLYLKWYYKKHMKKRLNLKNPKSFNEKLQWLKLYDRNPLYTTLADKYEVREYIKKTIGEEYSIPLLGVYNTFDEIDFDKLPNQFVIKCNHDSASVIICRDKKKFNYAKSKKQIEKSLKTNYYKWSREWAYKNIKPRIIIEKYMEDNNSKELKDYKFFCFNGEPKIMYLSEGLEDHSTARISFFDMEFKELPFKRKDYELFEEHPGKPKNFDKMIELSKKLSNNIPQVRVDWYEINGKLYFGELTFYTCAGYIPFDPEEWDYKIGEMLKLPEKWKYRRKK